MVKDIAIKKKKSGNKGTTKKKQVQKGLGNIAPLVALRSEVDHLFDRFTEEWPGLPSLFERFWTEPFRAIERRLPLSRFELSTRADISETTDNYEVTIELPGVVEKDIDVTLSDDTLTVKAEKKEEYEEKKKDHHIRERNYGSIQRAFVVPRGVNTANVSSSFSNGVLKISLPKTNEAKEKKHKIKVTASS